MRASIEDGLLEDGTVRHVARLCAHHACKYIGSLPHVLEEMASPSEFTQTSFDRWVHYYELGSYFNDDDTKAVQESAATLAQDIHEESVLLEVVDRMYPSSNNVVKMNGTNNAGIYVVNHHPYVGLDRQKKHREENLQVQGYHDSLAASIGDLLMARLKPEVLHKRLSAHVLRAAAVRTLIGGVDGSTTYLEVQPTAHGPQINEITV